MVRKILLNNKTGFISYQENYLADPKDILGKLLKEISFNQEFLFLYGREVLVPRLISWHGNPGINYKYSGKNHLTLPWTPTLLFLKELVEQETNESFNSVLLNLYRGGADYMSWHADDENELGLSPVIASISLGSERIFEIKKKENSKPDLSLILNSGSLLVMGGLLQQFYHHRLKKEVKIRGVRINLTFRKIFNRPF